MVSKKIRLRLHDISNQCSAWPLASTCGSLTTVTVVSLWFLAHLHPFSVDLLCRMCQIGTTPNFHTAWQSSQQLPFQFIPSWELTYPPEKSILRRWFSSAGICIRFPGGSRIVESTHTLRLLKLLCCQETENLLPFRPIRHLGSKSVAWRSIFAVRWVRCPWQKPWGRTSTKKGFAASKYGGETGTVNPSDLIEI